MQFDTVATWILVGLMSGAMAGLLIKPGGYGLLADLLLGLAGSLVGIAIFYALAMSAEGRLVMAVVAFAGAASVLAGQRWWCAHA